MNNKAKAGVSAPALAVIRTAEAERTVNPIIRLLAVTLKENHSDLSQLPYGM
jgi:hypothetical protein